MTTWDLPLGLRAGLAQSQVNRGAGVTPAPVAAIVADVYGLMHDTATAERYLAASDPDDTFTKAEASLITAYAAFDQAGSWAAAILPLETLWGAWQADPALQESFYDAPCYLGAAYGYVGRLAEAEEVFKSAGPWARCSAFHGDILALSGDFSGAKRVWAEGVKTAPDLPLVYLHRGIWETGQDNLKAAEADLSIAHVKAPHFADPLKAWGDLLAKEGRWKDAGLKYEEALKYAPDWAALRQARDAAAAHKG